MSDIDITWVKAEGERLRRWGKWGDDGKGALNLITPDHIVSAASLVRRVGWFLSRCLLTPRRPSRTKAGRTLNSDDDSISAIKSCPGDFSTPMTPFT